MLASVTSESMVEKSLALVFYLDSSFKTAELGNSVQDFGHTITLVCLKRLL